MKKAALLLPGLIGIVWLLINYTQKPTPPDNSILVSSQETANPSAVPPSHRVTHHRDNSIGISTNDSGEDESIETSWMKEMRELKELAARDPDAALTQVAQMPDKEERVSALKAVCLQIAEKDPAKALTSAWELGLGHIADELSDGKTLEKLAGQWAVVDLSAALTWAGNQPGDEEKRRDLVMKGIASVWSQTSPEDAALLVTTQMTPEHEQFEAAMDVVRKWAVKDYDRAAAWVDMFPEGPIRDRAREELSSAITNQSPSEFKVN